MWFMNSSSSEYQQSGSANKNVNVSAKEDGHDNTQNKAIVPSVNESPGSSSPNFPRPLSFLESRIRQASDLDSKFLTTGCPHIDKFLHGGIPCFGVTEIFGESATAKTQMCLQLALFSQLPTAVGELKSKVVYINTESSFPVKRMVELAEYFCIEGQENPMNSIIVETVLDSDSLFRCLHVRIPDIVNKVRDSKIGLIIIDSLAAIYRAEYNVSEGVERAHDLRKVGAKLHQLGRSLEAAVVVVNQATASLSSGENIPALGLSWTNMVTTRLHMLRLPPDRFIEIVHACHIPPGRMKFNLSNQGISGISENVQDQKT